MWSDKSPLEAAVVGILFFYAWNYGPKIKQSIVNKLENFLKKRGFLKYYLVAHKIIKALLYAILALIILSIVYFVIWALFFSG